MRSRNMAVRLASVLTALAAVAGLAACGGGSSDQGGQTSTGGGDAAATTTSTTAQKLETNGPLTIGGWGGSYDKATTTYYLKPFEADRGPASRFVDASGTQVARLQAQKKANRIQWDLVDSISGADGFMAYKLGLLEPLPAELKAKLVKTLGEGKVSDFGFTMGNLGNAVTCNMEAMKACPATPAEFFDPQKFPQERSIKGFGPLETVTLAMEATGVPASETKSTPVDLDKAFGLLDKIKSKIKTEWQSGDEGNQLLRGGEVQMGVFWTGRIAQLERESGMKIQTVLDGAVYEPGYWAVVKGAPNKDAAFALLEWIADHPEQQAKWSQELQYSIPNPEALKFMPADAAAKLVDAPENFAKLAVPNYDWYVDNADALNTRWQNWLKG
jgi:putative spermidine/putrescine transport system substrate-binding protein